jgi:hypothetical protein
MSAAAGLLHPIITLIGSWGRHPVHCESSILPLIGFAPI